MDIYIQDIFIMFKINNFPYLALQVLTLRTNIRNLKRLNGKPSKDDSEESGTFANFTATLAQEYFKTNLLYENQSLRVNSFVEGFHDSLILYAFAIDAVSIVNQNLRP